MAWGAVFLHSRWGCQRHAPGYHSKAFQESHAQHEALRRCMTRMPLTSLLCMCATRTAAVPMMLMLCMACHDVLGVWPWGRGRGGVVGGSVFWKFWVGGCPNTPLIPPWGWGVFWNTTPSPCRCPPPPLAEQRNMAPLAAATPPSEVRIMAPHGGLFAEKQPMPCISWLHIVRGCACKIICPYS